jgi:hypothetical protein
LLASSATEQVLIEVSEAVGVGSAVTVSTGVSDGFGLAVSPPDVTAKPPMISVSTNKPEPDPIRTSLR